MERLFIGVVKNGHFHLLFPCAYSQNGVRRVTQTRYQDCLPPEQGELNLVEFEACAVAVQGHDRDGWIYSAQVVDTGDPIITALVEAVFGR